MKKKYAFYCSGKASRIIKFFEDKNQDLWSVNFVFYDGEDFETIKVLKNLFKSKLIVYFNINNFKGRILSQNVTDNLLENLVDAEVDYLFCFGSKVLKKNLVEVYENKIINFHPSILPSFPGIGSIDQALATSVQVLGNTAHFIDSGIDTGPIIMQSVMSRKDFNCYEDVLRLQLPMLEKIWNLLDEDKISVQENLVIINSEKVKCNFFSI